MRVCLSHLLPPTAGLARLRLPRLSATYTPVGTHQEKYGRVDFRLFSFLAISNRIPLVLNGESHAMYLSE
jgi:hypothetical protein